MPGSKTYYVYIMASDRNGTLYIGVTNNLLRRVTRHRNGPASDFTRRYHVRRLIHYETFAHIGEAILREKRLKKWKRQWKIRLIEQANPEWLDLYEKLVG